MMQEAITTFGAIVGLLTGIFVFFDRVLKGRPVSSLTIREDDGRKFVCVRISNISPYDVAILGVDVSPKTYFATDSMETRKLIGGALGIQRSFMIKPGNDKELILQPAFNADGMPYEVAPHRVTIRIWWRRGDATWLLQVPLFVFTDTVTIRALALDKP
jgi:hypothetical protein